MRSFKKIVITIFFLCFSQASAGTAQGEIKIDVLSGARADTAETAFQIPDYLNGFLRPVSGAKIDYHSSHPDADKALLVRAKKEAGLISWESDTLKDSPGDYYNLIWLAGIEKSGWRGGESHEFTLSINGEAWFIFKNLKDSSALRWTVAGRNGAELSFTSAMADRFGDLFGYMTLKLSEKDFKAGTPLLLEVRGQDAGSPDWYMTFEYSFNFRPRLRLEPALLRTGAAPSQMIRLSLDNLLPLRSIEITAPDGKIIREPLKVGGNIFFIPVEAVSAESFMPVAFSAERSLVAKESVKLEPTVRREIHLLSYSHNDIGYTDLQPEVEKKQLSNLREALDLIRKTKDYPEGAKFKWNMEVIWALESFMMSEPEERKREAVEAAKSGQLGLNALYANVLTGLASGVEMTHFTGYARKFSDQYSIPITTACVSDIPGFTWGTVAALGGSGVKYFSIAPNNGDRVGHIYDLGDKPFYWSSQSGEEKILTWVAGASYSSFHEGDVTRLGEEKILKLVRRLDESRYPYEIVQLPYTIGGDNGPPDPNLPDFVRRWNEKYYSPRLIISTHPEMFKAFEEKYGPSLPVLKGDFTPYWEDGAFSSAGETMMKREAADRLIQGEVLWSILSADKFPSAEYDEAWRQVTMFDEHTWGAHNSVTDPDSSFVKEQWAIKMRFAGMADSLSRALLARGAGGEDDGSVEVFNTNSWSRSDLVIVSKSQSRIGDRITDGNGRAVPSQRLTTGELAFVAQNVPPFGSKRYLISKGKGAGKGDAKFYGTSMENGLLSLTINGTTGAIDEFILKKDGLRLASGNGSGGLNRYWYVPGKNGDSALTLSNVTVKVRERGPLVVSFAVEGEAPGCRNFSSEIRLTSGINRIDIINRLDKLAVRTKESVHFGFPFSVPGGQMRYDVGWGIVRPEIDQLPGSCKNFFSIQSFLDLSGPDFGVTWASPDAALIEIGGINAEKPWMKRIEPSQTFYSYLMNNYWHTNYKADQEGPVTVRYSVRPHAKFRPEEAARFGREQREPLLVLPGRGGRGENGSLFTLSPGGVLVASCRPAGEGWHILLYNASDLYERVTISWNKSASVKLHQSDAFGKVGEPVGGEIGIPAYGLRYLTAIKEPEKETR